MLPPSGALLQTNGGFTVMNGFECVMNGFCTKKVKVSVKSENNCIFTPRM